MPNPPRKLAIATGGGDCPGLNAVIRAVVLRAHAAGIEVLGVEDGLNGLLEGTGATVRALTPIEVAPILGRGGTILGTTNRCSPFAWRDPGGLPRDRGDELLARAQALGIDLLINVGGDGSQAISLELARRGMAVIGVPKTIDNDLDATVETFGFGTAVQVVTDALDRLRTTAESHDRTMILEVMGRHAGWIALHSGIAGGADVVLIPELPYAPAHVARDLQRTLASGRHFALVVVAEGCACVGGEVTQRPVASGRLGPSTILGGAGQRVAEEIAAIVPELELRVTALGHIQRGGTPTAYDRLLASRLGVEAVEAALRGERCVLVSSQPPDIKTVPLELAVKKMRAVDPHGQLVAHARGLGISFGDA
ncbi:6-phosphofructokinase [Nannocystis punicea]|uniref:ATP-dependent 6-phosphofructokinase n=1 Tax=Nannocystis punicea TaxID=2995304 RepID=A0ABY7H2F8_9BACT|nr:ATP-dependent 6-phosphofructokinase [Nannocystis poenicansa]WAS93466.1 ATP-dependent 6-phosphofructokinase [Nannocystis poenicansa]